MSTAVLEPRIEQNIAQKNNVERAAQLEFVAAIPAPAISEEFDETHPQKFADPHPLLPIFVAGAFALLLSGTCVGSIVVWLLLRNSGVMAQ